MQSNIFVNIRLLNYDLFVGKSDFRHKKSPSPEGEGPGEAKKHQPITSAMVVVSNLLDT
jgi:hypothetical protein